MPLLERLPVNERTRQWPVWGTTARIVVTGGSEIADQAQHLVAELLDRIDLACSRFRPDSELAMVQSLAQHQPSNGVPVSPLLADLVEAALDAAARTGGDVDPTLADDLSALGYDRDFATLDAEPGPTGQHWTIKVTHRVRHDWRDVRLDRRDLRLALPPGVHLDLGASAKAVAADRAAGLAASTLGCGVLVALGGDIAVAGPPPAGGWQILVQDGEYEPAAEVSLFSGGLATSSTLSRTWWNGTRRVHHILDPRTGDPAPRAWRTVSVVAGSCAEANALSTASIVRGWKAIGLLREHGVPARLVGERHQIAKLGAWPADDAVSPALARTADAGAPEREAR